MNAQRTRLTRVIAIVTLAAVGVAGCGSDDEPADTAAAEPVATDAPDSTPVDTATTDEGSEPAAGGDALETAIETVANDPLFGTVGSGLTRGVSDDGVKVGCIYEAANYAGFETGIQARLAGVEIQGRAVELLPCEDDGTDPAQHLQIAKRLVEQEEVFAIINVSQVVSPAVATYLNESEVPYIGWGYLDAFCGKRWGFGFDGCINGPFSDPAQVPHPYINPYLLQPVVAQTGLAPEDIRAALIGADNDAGRGSNALNGSIFEGFGGTVVYSDAVVPVPGPTTDFTPFVQAALADDPNVIVLSTQFGDVGGLTAALKAAGFEGAIVNFVTYIPGLLDAQVQLAEALEGSFISASVVPQEAGGEYITAVEDALEEAGAETGRFITFGGSLGYLMADELASMLDAVGSDLNTQMFDEVINGGGYVYSNANADGPCSVPFPAAHFFSSSGAALIEVVDGAFEVVQPFMCYPPEATVR